MGKSKIHFKSNLDEPIRKAAAKPDSTTGQIPRRKAGLWIGGKKAKLLKVAVVNVKKDRSLLLKWILIWAVAIPLSFYLAVLLIMGMIDLFSF